MTPYYKEDVATLTKCLESVRGQTVPTDHIMVADGHPQSWIDELALRHIKLDQAHGDYGGVARSIGAILAIAAEYESISFLDADNWFDDNHIENCRELSTTIEYCDYVVARQRVVREDGSIMNVNVEPVETHVDTNCYYFLRGAFHALPIWGTMPKQASPVGDRFFLSALRGMGLRELISEKVTVNYQSLWELDYIKAGESPPANAKPNIDVSKLRDWRSNLSPREKEIAERLLRVKL